MIECRNCDFSVQQGMRHALSNNCCPACGGALLGELHKRRLDLFKHKLANQHFSKKLDSNDIFDIALFMLVEFFPPTKPDPQLEVRESEDASNEVDPELDESADEQEADESYEDIREQIRAEVLNSTEDITPEEMDEDLRIQRLKRIAKENRINKSGAIVRRVDS